MVTTMFADAERLRPFPNARDLERSASRSAVKIFNRLERLVCGLAGHEDLMRFEPARLSLYCSRCGYQSTGWEILSPGADQARKRTGIAATPLALKS